ncbi:hypothetical protein [Saccharothrix stipae]
MAAVEEFGQRFVRENTDVIQVDGEEVRLRMVLKDVLSTSRLRIEFRDYTREVGQALCVATARGTLRAADANAGQLILWADSVPSEVSVELGSADSSDVFIWNAWGRRGGGVDAALRFAGMKIVDAGPNTWMLYCSDGVGQANFNDLVVRLELV